MKYIRIEAGTYNAFCYKLDKLGYSISKIEQAGSRYKMYDDRNNLVATYDERKNHGLIVKNHSVLSGKILKF